MPEASDDDPDSLGEFVDAACWTPPPYDPDEPENVIRRDLRVRWHRGELAMPVITNLSEDGAAHFYGKALIVAAHLLARGLSAQEAERELYPPERGFRVTRRWEFDAAIRILSDRRLIS